MQATEEIAAPAAAPAESDAPPSSQQEGTDSQQSAAASDWFGESGGNRGARNGRVNSFMRELMGAPTSKPTESTPAGESAPEPSGDVKPEGQRARQQNGRWAPRRGGPKAVAEAESKAQTAEERIRDLEAQLAERDPEKLRSQWEQERQAAQTQSEEQARLEEMARTRKERVERYYRLLDVPDDELYRTNPEDYAFREEMKSDLAKFPDVRAFYETSAEQRVAQAEQAHVSGLRSALSRHAKYDGVDKDAFKKQTDWGALGDQLYEGGKRARQPEIDKRDARIKELEGEVRQLRMSGRSGMGAAREPVGAGRSAFSVPRDSRSVMNDFMRYGR